MDDAAVRADLFAFLDSGESEAAEALCLIGPAALPGLIERLHQGSAEMRKQLLRQASELQEKNPHLGDLFPGVLTCLKHEDEKVRQAALRVLRGCKRRSAALLPDLLRMLAGLDPKDWCYYCVTRALEAMGSTAAAALEALRAEDRAGQ